MWKLWRYLHVAESPREGRNSRRVIRYSHSWKMTRKWTHLREVSLQLALKEIFWNKGVSYRGKKKEKSCMQDVQELCLTSHFQDEGLTKNCRTLSVELNMAEL